MSQVSAFSSHYDKRTIFLHWATFALVVLQFITAWTIDDFPNGAPRTDARSIHITLGVLLLLVLIARIAWRASAGRQLPDPERGVLQLASTATHWGLYLLLLAMLGVGLFLTWVRGDNLFTLVSIPAFDPGNRALRHDVQHLHALIGWAIIALTGLHAFAALVHRYLFRDGVLDRMLPRTGNSR